MRLDLYESEEQGQQERNAAGGRMVTTLRRLKSVCLTALSSRSANAHDMRWRS